MQLINSADHNVKDFGRNEEKCFAMTNIIVDVVTRRNGNKWKRLPGEEKLLNILKFSRGVQKPVERFIR